jgi:hypothetical protein
MTQQQTFDELKELARELGLVVRHELGNFEGGLCVLKSERVILINRRHDMSRRINVVARALHEAGLEDRFIKPALRELIEDEVARAETSHAST